MKKSLVLAVLMVFAGNLIAQDYKEEIEYIRKIWGKEKKALTEEVMGLKADEAAKFWPLYEEYQAGRRQISEDRFTTIKSYADSYESMTDDKAKELANAVLKNNEALNKLQSKYFKKISKAVSPTRAAQFLQLENYIDAQLRAELADAIPFIPDPVKQ